MTNAEIGLPVSSPTLNGSRRPPVQALKAQNPLIQVAYNPTTQACTCSPSSVTFSKGNSGNIVVSIGLSPGSSGSIQFSDSPVNWGTTGQPPGASINLNGNKTQVTITNPNSSAGTYTFTVNYVYTPTSGSPVSGSGDPTIINEGTGTGDGDDDRHGDQDQGGAHRRRVS